MLSEKWEEIIGDSFERAIKKSDVQSKAIDTANKYNDDGMLGILHNALSKLKLIRPDERSERSRHYTVTITEMEKVVAYFETWIINKG